MSTNQESLKCPRCGHIFARSSDYPRHIKKKVTCKPDLNDVVPTMSNVIHMDPSGTSPGSSAGASLGSSVTSFTSGPSAAASSRSSGGIENISLKDVQLDNYTKGQKREMFMKSLANLTGTLNELGIYDINFEGATIPDDPDHIPGPDGNDVFSIYNRLSVEFQKMAKDPFRFFGREFDEYELEQVLYNTRLIFNFRTKMLTISYYDLAHIIESGIIPDDLKFSDNTEFRKLFFDEEDFRERRARKEAEKNRKTGKTDKSKSTGKSVDKTDKKTGTDRDYYGDKYYKESYRKEESYIKIPEVD
jgi:hypothetical protein